MAVHRNQREYTDSQIEGRGRASSRRKDKRTPAMTNHSVHFYENDAVLLNGLTEFFANALDSGGACLIIATRPHRAEIADRLEQAGFDLFRLTQAHRYINLEAFQTLSQFLVEGWPDQQLFARTIEAVLLRARGPAGQKIPPMFVFGEMTALLWAEGKCEAAIHLEQIWNDFGRTRALSLRCAYPGKCFADVLQDDLFRRLCAEHRHVIQPNATSR